jgi:protein tyrosine/serine phosphatase
MRQRLRIMEMGCLTALLVAGAMIACAAPATAQDACALDFPLDSNPTSITPKDICNFHQVDAQLYRGGRPRASAYPKLAEVGIRTIINLEEKEYADAERQAIDNLNRGLPPDRQIRFISCPIDSAEIEEKGIPGDHLKSIFKQMQEADKPIFIHCYHGKDRTSAIVVLYRLVMNQKSAEEAYQEAYHYLFSQEDHGLARTIEQYRTPKKLKSLPRPVPAP